MSWHTSHMVGFDIESSGLNVETDRIVTACVVGCGAGDPVTSTTWLADPGIDIPAEAAAVHGITTEKARAEGRPAAEVVEEIVHDLAEAVTEGLPIVVMNAPFDFTLLDREARRHGVTPLTDLVGDELRVIDPRVMDKAVDPYRKGRRTLTDLCSYYGLRLDAAHTADADALAACRVAWALAEKWPQLRGSALDELHAVQQQWAAQQATSYAAYLARTPGREHEVASVRTDWPFVPHQRGAA
ncbi:exonuclease domain-containing protein [Streptomyces sp. JV185]|uniref:exonuclease domain-containing protein n=1 Tax=Streptomyces sp. JV185 TaxID=858638 RepID=UPI002E7953A7|nr:exonuclease domain-containing protein [Streptomyces sp. JV185]MEE1774487.1 exonuclease domain-containing protein [Streptomyces sp. JV185]